MAAKVTIKVEGCPYEDRDTLSIYAHALNLYSALSDARLSIRNRIKNGEELSDKEYEHLNDLMDLLFVDGIEF